MLTKGTKIHLLLCIKGKNFTNEELLLQCLYILQNINLEIVVVV